jgi:hypothetical protein
VASALYGCAGTLNKYSTILNGLAEYLNDQATSKSLASCFYFDSVHERGVALRLMLLSNRRYVNTAPTFFFLSFAADLILDFLTLNFRYGEQNNGQGLVCLQHLFQFL